MGGAGEGGDVRGEAVGGAGGGEGGGSDVTERGEDAGFAPLKGPSYKTFDITVYTSCSTPKFRLFFLHSFVHILYCKLKVNFFTLLCRCESHIRIQCYHCEVNNIIIKTIMKY